MFYLFIYFFRDFISFSRLQISSEGRWKPRRKRKMPTVIKFNLVIQIWRRNYFSGYFWFVGSSVQIAQNDVWYHFKEGYSNAVRRGVKMADFIWICITVKDDWNKTKKSVESYNTVYWRERKSERGNSELNTDYKMFLNFGECFLLLEQEDEGGANYGTFCWRWVEWLGINKQHWMEESKQLGKAKLWIDFFFIYQIFIFS